MTIGSRLRFAVVDDDEGVRLALQRLLCASGHKVQLFGSAEELLAQDVLADCFLLDICLPLLNGLELEKRIRSTNSDVPIVLMTGYKEEPRRAEIAQYGLPLLRIEEDAGVGLGLSIARRCIEVHRGTIKAENAAGGGLRVTIRIPVERVMTKAELH